MLEIAKLAADLKSVEAENTQLRKLIYDALRPRYDESLRMTIVQWWDYYDDVRRRANELGIEV